MRVKARVWAVVMKWLFSVAASAISRVMNEMTQKSFNEVFWCLFMFVCFHHRDPCAFSRALLQEGAVKHVSTRHHLYLHSEIRGQHNQESTPLSLPRHPQKECLWTLLHPLWYCFLLYFTLRITSLYYLFINPAHYQYQANPGYVILLDLPLNLLPQVIRFCLFLSMSVSFYSIH